MAAGKLDIHIEQGATFKNQLIWKDKAQVVIDLTNYTARMQIRPKVASATLHIELTTENNGIVLGGAAGTIDLIITSAVTALIKWPKAAYDLELIDVNGEVIRLVEGNAIVAFNVTRNIIT